MKRYQVTITKVLKDTTTTTGIGLFAECLSIKHSTKSLPSVALGKESSVNCTSATAKHLGKEK
jgi:hypothetical protein